ncbi:hypothetical protein V1525DRAFT_436252 [Lipomyces kononenkoae]|uniref:Uncharacterized protein n=1 Tax=Lipomyces kononenkoae TaxID=34357 RepID=A0ACC3SQX5_LIPKO
MPETEVVIKATVTRSEGYTVLAAFASLSPYRVSMRPRPGMYRFLGALGIGIGHLGWR